MNDDNKLVAVNLGDDFMNITDKLTAIQRGQLTTKAMVTLGRM